MRRVETQEQVRRRVAAKRRAGRVVDIAAGAAGAVFALLVALTLLGILP